MLLCSMVETATDAEADFAPITAHAVLLGERIDTAGLERRDALSTMPLAVRVGEQGVAVVFRYGVVVLIGLDPPAEDEVLRGIAPRVAGPFPNREEEAVRLARWDGREERIDPDGVVCIADRTPPRLLIVADALGKSAALAHDERQVSEVFDALEPWSRDLATRGRPPGGRRSMIRMIGSALLVEHRVSGRVAVGEKPDLLWDRPDLERLYARLETEYELDERAEVLNRKLGLIGQTARLMTDLIDTERALRLEAAIVILIVAEIGLTLLQMARG
ncbi:RMD1 family protein [Phenylobacterium sp.]|uniref:RMD1 family protein n=1 Tax=Phenylobacterium sp. TaxID=1871053 RepID=UPI002E373FCD|nr:RMD1 family protein [Phenylobacterium sp.]HEX4712770.1 RMD1 family protein [Phenylobacterium sp.]